MGLCALAGSEKDKFLDFGGCFRILGIPLCPEKCICDLRGL